MVVRNPGEERMQAHPSAMRKDAVDTDGKSAEEQVWGTKIESEIWIDCIRVSSKWKCVVIVSGAERGGLNRGNQGKRKLREGQSIGRKGESAWIEAEEAAGPRWRREGC